MDDTGFLCDDGYSRCHLDLNAAPRNVMVNIQADGSAAITGILDWDSAVFGPKFVGCAPPIYGYGLGIGKELKMNEKLTTRH